MSVRASAGFIFFILFLAGLALVNLGSIQDTQVGAAADLADVAWQPTQLGATPLADDSALFVQVDTDGSFIGFGGCNRIFGDITTSENTLTIGPVGSTRIACPGRAGADEAAFLDALQQANSGARVGNRLVLRNKTGDIIVRFSAIEREAEQ